MIARGLCLALEAGNLWEILAVVVFLLAPMWRGVLEARKQARESREKALDRPLSEAPDGGLPDSGLPDSGLPGRGLPDSGLPDGSPNGPSDPWEALLRGELPVEEAPTPGAAVEETRVEELSVPAAQPVEPLAQVLGLPNLDPEMVQLLAERPRAPELGDMQVHSTDTADVQGEADATRTASTERRHRQRGVPGGSELKTRGAYYWREGIVVTDLLGAPVALRRPGAGGPAGLR